MFMTEELNFQALRYYLFPVSQQELENLLLTMTCIAHSLIASFYVPSSVVVCNCYVFIVKLEICI